MFDRILNAPLIISFYSIFSHFEDDFCSSYDAEKRESLILMNDKINNKCMSRIFFILVYTELKLLKEQKCLLVYNCKSSHRRSSVKKLFSKISQVSQDNICVRASFYKVAGLKACNFIKKRLQHRCFSVEFAKFLRTPTLKKICE